MKSRYIFIDIDGTLLDHRTGIPESSFYAICQARENGNKVFICTGRAKSEISSHILDIGFDGFVYSSGAVVEVDGQQLLMAQIDSSDIEVLIPHMEKRKIGYNLEGYFTSYLDPISENFFNNLLDKSKFNNSEIASLLMANDSMAPITEYDKNSSIINKVSMYSDSIDAFNDLRKYIAPRFKMIIHEDTDDSILNAEIFLADISKATGIDLILEHYSASLEDTICIGDSINDIEMIEHCKVGICMGNGVETVKKIADYVTDSITNNGLYNGFKKYNLI